jgi:hypothetical protein
MSKRTKIPGIDALFFNEATAVPIRADNAAEQKEAVGAIQELLTCQGYNGMPSKKEQAYGLFGPKTTKHLKHFRLSHKLQKPDDPVEVDRKTLIHLVQNLAESPRSSIPYLALSLEIEINSLTNILSFITMAEGAGKFAAFNDNTDKQGLSYGIIQWAQKKTRLTDILLAFKNEQPALFSAVFGASASGMIVHTQKPFGGVHKDTGISTDDDFDLIKEPWKSRFKNAALQKPLQKIQVKIAQAAFRQLVTGFKNYAHKIRSERAYGFMLDLGNQHGPTGARSIYKAVVTELMTEDQVLEALSKESVKRVKALYPPKEGEVESKEVISTRDRREFFRTTTLLSNDDFNEN